MFAASSADRTATRSLTKQRDLANMQQVFELAGVVACSAVTPDADQPSETQFKRDLSQQKLIFKRYCSSMPLGGPPRPLRSEIAPNGPSLQISTHPPPLARRLHNWPYFIAYPQPSEVIHPLPASLQVYVSTHSCCSVTRKSAVFDTKSCSRRKTMQARL